MPSGLPFLSLGDRLSTRHADTSDLEATQFGARLRRGSAAGRQRVAVAIAFLLVSLTLLDRFGLQIKADFAAPSSLIAVYLLVATIALSGLGRIGRVELLIYACACGLALCSFLVNAALDATTQMSVGSLMFLLVIYLPFLFTLEPAFGTRERWNWVIRKFIGLCLLMAVLGILQYFVQTVARVPWLFDFRQYIPEILRGTGDYNTANQMHDATLKPNGFFLREPANFSWYLALALMCEWHQRRRALVLGTMAFAIVLAHSGSGLLALGIALLFPLNSRTVWRLAGIAGVGVIVYVLFGEALKLDYTVGRLYEFQSDESSAACRFVLPAQMVATAIDSSWWSTLIGHGPGTTSRAARSCEPTFAKVVYEYGLLGTIAFGWLIARATGRCGLPVRIRAVLLVQWWLLGGHLLTPMSPALIYLLAGMWPAGAAADTRPTDAGRASWVEARPQRRWRLFSFPQAGAASATARMASMPRAAGAGAAGRMPAAPPTATIGRSQHLQFFRRR